MNSFFFYHKTLEMQFYFELISVIDKYWIIICIWYLDPNAQSIMICNSLEDPLICVINNA